MKFSPKTFLAAVSLPFLMTACASNSDDVKQISANDLLHHNWVLVSVDGNEVKTEGRQQSPNRSGWPSWPHSAPIVRRS